MAWVLSETIDAVRVITLHRPDRHNAINDEMAEDLHAAWDAALADETTGAILIRGEGPSFCSGRDLTVLGHRARQESDFHFVRRAQVGRITPQLECPKPI